MLYWKKTNEKFSIILYWSYTREVKVNVIDGVGDDLIFIDDEIVIDDDDDDDDDLIIIIDNNNYHLFKWWS